ncbi:UNVERIFIED_CONTAM: hypothetical protein FKN15_014640 [Acipenser sinensis]
MLYNQSVSVCLQKHCCILPEDLRDFYLTTDGFQLTWSAKFDGQPVPLGSMVINSVCALSPLCESPLYSLPSAPTLADLDSESDSEGVESQPVKPHFDSRSRIFELDACNGNGKVCLVYRNVKPRLVAQQCEVWFLDRALYWHFLTESFTAYYRLMVTHLGLPEWQYRFTKHGPSPQTKVKPLTAKRGVPLRKAAVPCFSHGYTRLGHTYSPHFTLSPLTLLSAPSLCFLFLGVESQPVKPHFDSQSRIFELDACNGNGKVCLVYRNVKPRLVAQQCEVWFLDRALYWHFLTESFTAYYRLMVTHLGLPEWQYRFTKHGPSPQTKQWSCLYRPITSSCDPHTNQGEPFLNKLDPSRAFRGKAKLPTPKKKIATQSTGAQRGRNVGASAARK